LVSTRKPITAYNAFFKKELPGLKKMRTFGEIAIVNDHKTKKMRGKLDDRGSTPWTWRLNESYVAEMLYGSTSNMEPGGE
jgi:hypothetical protein